MGQYTTLLCDAAELLCIPPCGLHLILAHHRYMWQHVFNILHDRKQLPLVAGAFISIGCHYLGHQHETYFQSKQKYYDGSSTLKMIGQDCKEMEAQIDKILSKFLRENETIHDMSAESLRHISTIYKLFTDLAKDIRNTAFDPLRVATFQSRVNEYYSKFKKYSMSDFVSGKPYMHILRDHIAVFMAFWGKHMNWGWRFQL